MNTCAFINEDGSEVPAHRHINPDGSVGGWVADTAKIGENAFIDPGAIVGPDEVIAPGAHIHPDIISVSATLNE